MRTKRLTLGSVNSVDRRRAVTRMSLGLSTHRKPAAIRTRLAAVASALPSEIETNRIIKGGRGPFATSRLRRSGVAAVVRHCRSAAAKDIRTRCQLSAVVKLFVAHAPSPQLHRVKDEKRRGRWKQKGRSALLGDLTIRRPIAAERLVT